LRKNKIVYRVLYLFFRFNIRIFLQQNSIVVVSLFANIQKLFFKILKIILNYTRNIDTIISLVTLLKITNINNNYIYNSIAFF